MLPKNLISRFDVILTTYHDGRYLCFQENNDPLGAQDEVLDQKDPLVETEEGGKKEEEMIEQKLHAMEEDQVKEKEDEKLRMEKEEQERKRRKQELEEKRMQEEEEKEEEEKKKKEEEKPLEVILPPQNPVGPGEMGEAVQIKDPDPETKKKIGNSTFL